MDALLITLLGCLLGETGDKSQWLVLALATRFGRDGAVIAGIVVASLANAALGAVAGHFMGAMMGSDARLLFLALSLIFLGIGMLWRVRQPDPLANWRIGAFLTTTLGLFILGFGDGSQFLVLGVAARTADPWLAAIGGAAGMIAAMIPVVLMRQKLFDVLPILAIRRGGGALVLMIGLAAAISALHLA